jgi:hypothetical protein
MSAVGFPTHQLRARRQYALRYPAALLAAILVATAVASITVEQCRTVPRAFSRGFSDGFDVSRKVCSRTALGYVAAAKIEDVADWAFGGG